MRPRSGRLAGAVLAVLLLLLPQAALAQGPPAPKPDLSGDAAGVFDAKTGELIWGRNVDKKHAIASITKMMTALVVRDNTELDDVFTVPAYNASPVETKVGFKRGEKVTVEDLLEGLMLPSGNDAAATLAEGVGGTRRKFIAMMNEKAEELGLENTHFSTPVGLDDPGNYSTVSDLAVMARELRSDKEMAKIVDSPKATLESGARERTVINRNRLISQYPWVDGIKTGHTSDAGYSLVGSGKRGKVQVISVALGAPSESARDSDSIQLLKYGAGQFRKARAVAEGKVVGNVDAKFFEDKSTDIVTAGGYSLIVRRGEKVKRTITPLPEELEGPLPAGRQVGTMTITYRDKVVKKIPLVTSDALPAAGTLRKAYTEVGPTGAAVAFLTLALIFGLTALRINAVRRRKRKVARVGRRR